VNAVAVDNRAAMTSLPEGYISRPATKNDLEAVVALINAHAWATISAKVTTVETQRLEWETPGFNLDTDTRVVVAPDGQLAGYMQVWDTSEPHSGLWSWGRVHPDHRGKGIADCLIEWTELWACQSGPEGARVALIRRDVPCARKMAEGCYPPQ